MSGRYPFVLYFYMYRFFTSKVTELKKIKFSTKRKKSVFNLTENYRLIKKINIKLSKIYSTFEHLH